MKKHRLIAAALISLLTFGSAQTALAEVIYHDINDTKDSYIIEGAYVIGTDEDEDYDEHIFFTSGENKTLNYSIIVNDYVITKIVLKGVNIETTDKSGISIGSDADVVLELVGENSITVNSDDYYYEAGINVANGTLTIKGGENDSLNVAVENDKNINYAAAIGANGYDDFTGKINVEGGKIKATSSFGAGIGSGYFGDMFGTITISGGKVEASSAYSAGIGSGYRGEMSGSIAISGGEVTASSERGAGIGAGDTMSGTGTITISGGEVTASSSSNGAGIGSGLYGEMSGNINISGGKVNATSKYDAGIGSGAEGNMSGTITISGGEVTASSTGDGAGIGSGAEFVSGIAPEMSGTIAISGGKVTAGISIGVLGPRISRGLPEIEKKLLFQGFSRFGAVASRRICQGQLYLDAFLSDGIVACPVLVLAAGAVGEGQSQPCPGHGGSDGGGQVVITDLGSHLPCGKLLSCPVPQDGVVVA